MFVTVALLNKDSTAIPTRPSSGVMRPAMQSRRVDLPAPDGPKRMVMPGGREKSTSSLKEEEAPARLKRTRTERVGWVSSIAIGHRRGDLVRKPTREERK